MNKKYIHVYAIQKYIKDILKCPFLYQLYTIRDKYTNIQIYTNIYIYIYICIIIYKYIYIFKYIYIYILTYFHCGSFKIKI